MLTVVVAVLNVVMSVCCVVGDVADVVGLTVLVDAWVDVKGTPLVAEFSVVVAVLEVVVSVCGVVVCDVTGVVGD